jgi:hypothetical protein
MSDREPETGYIEDGRFYTVPNIADPIHIEGPPLQAIPVTSGTPTPAPASPAPGRTPTWPKLAIAFLATLVVVALGALAFLLLRPSDSSAATTQIAACRDKVKAQLKAPATAQFSEEAVSKQPTGEFYEVNGVVDAQNGFGALLRQRYRCTVSESGEALAVTLTEWN